MKTIETLILNSVDELYFMGDIHSSFGECAYYTNLHLTNSVVIVLGDIGMGFYEDEYYHKIFSRVNETLKIKNNRLCFIRGNHDNPLEFNEPDCSFSWKNYSNINVIADYTVIELYKPDESLLANVLCVGGATSIDRVYRMNQEKMVGGNTTYWHNEQPYVSEEMIKQINKVYANNIQVVCTHTTPSFAYPQSTDNIVQWFENDPTLEEDIIKERHIMDNIFWLLKDGGQNSIEKWVYGHFHSYHKDIHHDIEFVLCDCLKLYPYEFKPEELD